MKVVIVGCGRVGAAVAASFDEAGHQVIIVDRSTAAFDKLEESFGGTAVRGDGTDEDVLRRAGADDADLFVAMTEGDNRNTMSAQLAVEALGAKRVVAKINDPLRAEAYADLGIATICRTDLMLDAILAFVDLAPAKRPGVYAAKNPHPVGGHLEVDEASLTPPASGTPTGPAATGGDPITQAEA